MLTSLQLQISTLLIAILLSVSFAEGTTELIILNNCKETIWPGVLATTGHQTPRDGGFRLPSGDQTVIQLPEHWSGRIWTRQGCYFDENTRKGSCQTGDCAGLLQCKGIGGRPPATLVEMTFGTSKSDLHYYDVSLIDGFNVPVSMVPLGDGGGVHCGVAECEVDLNVFCPSSLALKRKGQVLGCKSACLAAKSDRYCCTGEFADPIRCRPTVFGKIFKAVCPRAYSYPYNDANGLKTCRASRLVPDFPRHRGTHSPYGHLYISLLRPPIFTPKYSKTISSAGGSISASN
ncbi:hypothetical protein ACFE04_030623 [Oxalis oulophora]